MVLKKIIIKIWGFKIKFLLQIVILSKEREKIINNNIKLILSKKPKLEVPPIEVKKGLMEVLEIKYTHLILFINNYWKSFQNLCRL